MDNNKLTAQQRAAKVVWYLARNADIGVSQIMELTGLTQPGSCYLMQNVGFGAPLVRLSGGRWQLNITSGLGQFDNELSPQARAARATYLLTLQGKVTTDELRLHTGLKTSAGIVSLMENIAAVVPVIKVKRALWKLTRVKEQGN